MMWIARGAAHESQRGGLGARAVEEPYRSTDGDYNLLLTRYGLERLLYRLSVSPHAPNFLLKGALLFLLWHDGSGSTQGSIGLHRGREVGAQGDATRRSGRLVGTSIHA